MRDSTVSTGVLVLLLIVFSLLPAFGLPVSPSPGITPGDTPTPSVSPYILSPVPSPAVKESLKPQASPTGEPSASPPEKREPTLEESLRSMNLVQSHMKIMVNGKRMEIPVVIQQKYKDVYVPLKDRIVQELFTRLGTKVVFDRENRAIAITSLFDDTGPMEIKIEIPASLTGRDKKIKISPPPFVLHGEAYLSLKHVPLITSAVMSQDGKSHVWYIEPALTSIRLVQEKKRLVLKAVGTARIAPVTCILKSPRRYVIDIPHAHLGKNLLEAPQKEIFNKSTGRIIYNQNRINPGRVRIVIPLFEDLAVGKLQSAKENEIMFSLVSKGPCPLGMNFVTQDVQQVTTSPRGHDFLIQVSLSGPAEYEWRRFKPPDNRFIVDIHRAILKGRKKSIRGGKDSLIEEIRVAQFKSKPEPVVRIVIELNDCYRCRFVPPTAGGAQRLNILVEHTKIGMDEAVLNGNGITSFPHPGKKVLCIDPGHGGPDCGAVNYTLNLEEEDVTLSIARELSSILVSEGYNVVLTRTTDRDVSYYGSSDLEELAARVKVASDMKADLFVSVHCNASANKNVKGFSTHWYKQSDYAPAEAIHGRMCALLETTDKKMHQDRFYVLKRTSMPAVLIETSFITNPQDGALLQTARYRRKIAEAIASGINLYFRKK